MSQIPVEMNTESTSNSNYVNSLTELKLMIAILEAKNQTLQGKVENLEMKAKIRALKENAEQKADSRSMAAASDFDQIDHPDEVPNQQEEQQGQAQFGFQQNPLVDTGSTRNYDNVLKEHKLMIEKLEAQNQTLQGKVENLELKAEIRALKDNAEQKTKYQALEAKFVQMLSTQNEEHRKEMTQLKDGLAKEIAQLEAKNRKLEEKLESNAEVQTTKNGALEAKMDQIQNEFSKMLAEQRKQIMRQFQLEQKLNDAEQRTQTGKNELEEDNQQKMEKFREEMDKNGQQAIDSNLNKSKILIANPKGIVWNRSKTDASVNISECGLKATNTRYEFGFALAMEGYAISGEHCRKENFKFPGTILYYYEITSDCIWHKMGFTDGSKHDYPFYGKPNSYGIAHDSLWLSGMKQDLDWPTGVVDGANVIGSGLLINSKNELSIFFTFNGILRVKQTPINPTVDRLYPTVSIYYGIPKGGCTVEANFGDNLVANPFKFDTDKWPGLVFE